ncbi:hypothetical protein D915_007560 [Fasciola hepatica]|uniref:Uncharacterized protein n=1 Tax=Fasciola hepatica TaxID=6192 RepID=A0A2H1C2D6_FASHE|nr:hypothetical protein D915_007560 [Fasciola hepatica]
MQILHKNAEIALCHIQNCGLGHVKRVSDQHTECDRTNLLFRPISVDWTRQLPTLDRTAYAHQALILGFLCAMLSDRPIDHSGAAVDWTPNTPTLIAWSGRTLQQWPTYIQNLLADYPEVHFHLLSRDSPQSTHSVFIHLTSYDLVRSFQAKDLRRKERVTQQFVLARCLLTSLYGLFGESHSRLL